MKNKLTKKLQSRFKKKEDVLARYPAKMGDGSGHLYPSGLSGFVYCVVGGYVETVRCSRVTPELGKSVWVGWSKEKVYQVLEVMSDDSTLALGTGVGYAPAKRYEHHAVGGGQDELHVQKRQFMPLSLQMTYPKSMSIILVSGDVWSGSAFIAVAQTTIDMTSYIPSTAGKAALVLVTIKYDGTIVKTKGSEVDITALVRTDQPAPPAGTVYVCGAIRVYNTQTEVQDGRTNTDFWDTRFGGWYTRNPTGHGATTVTAAGTTTLDLISETIQEFTGATTQTVTLPVVSTLRLGHEFRIINNSTGVITVNSSGGNLVTIVAAGAIAFISSVLITGTSAASWSVFNPAANYSTLASMSAANAAALVGGAVTTLHDHARLQPDADSTTAVQIQNAAGAAVVNIDTSNGNVGIGTTGPTAKLHIVGSTDTQQLIVKGNATQTTNLMEWQNSSGTVLGNFTKTGTLTLIPTSAQIALTISGILTNNTVNRGISINTEFQGTGTNSALYLNSYQSSIASGGYYGVQFVPRFAATSGGPQVAYYGFSSNPIIISTASANVTNVYAITSRIDNLSTAGSTLANAYSLFISTPTATGTITNEYGIYVANQNTAGTLNYAIYTNLGEIHFGDTVGLASGKNLNLLAGNITTDTTTGTQVATSTAQKIAFHGSTPVIQRAGAAQVAVATTGATNTTPYGYTTAAQADAIITLLNEIRDTLVEKGLMKGAA